jgi:hypothetical protein
MDVDLMLTIIRIKMNKNEYKKSIKIKILNNYNWGM